MSGRVERPGLTLAEAQGDATFCVLGAVARRLQRAGGVPTFRERLAVWFAEIARKSAGRRFVPYF